MMATHRACPSLCLQMFAASTEHHTKVDHLVTCKLKNKRDNRLTAGMHADRRR